MFDDDELAAQLLVTPQDNRWRDDRGVGFVSGKVPVVPPDPVSVEPPMRRRSGDTRSDLRADETDQPADKLLALLAISEKLNSERDVASLLTLIA